MVEIRIWQACKPAKGYYWIHCAKMPFWKGNIISIRRIVTNGLCQWNIGRGLTRRWIHLHGSGNRIQLPSINEYIDDSSLTDNDPHSFLPLNKFTNNNSIKQTIRTVLSLPGHSACGSRNERGTNNVLACSSIEITHIVLRVLDHVCGHASLENICTLLQNNDPWNSDVWRILVEISRKVSKLYCCYTAWLQMIGFCYWK